MLVLDPRRVFAFSAFILSLAVLGCGSREGENSSSRSDQDAQRSVESAAEPEIVRMEGATMGTSFAVTLVDPPEDLAEDWRTQVDSVLRTVNDQMSTYIEDSELSRFNRHETADWFPVSRDLAYVVQSALEISEKTSGAFDVTVGPLVNAWNFGPGKRTRKPPTDEEIALLQESVGYELLEVRMEPPALRKAKPGVYVDLSAIAKGYGVDKLVELMASLGCKHVFVDIGGEDRVLGRRGNRPWRVAVEDPVEGVRQFQYAIELNDEAIATSGDYRNFFVYEGKRYSHTIDPSTGYPVDHHVALVSVLHQSCMEADGWATAMNVLGDERGVSLAEELGLATRFVIRNPDDSTHAIATRNFPPNIFPES